MSRLVSQYNLTVAVDIVLMLCLCKRVRCFCATWSMWKASGRCSRFMNMLRFARFASGRRFMPLVDFLFPRWSNEHAMICSLGLCKSEFNESQNKSTNHPRHTTTELWPCSLEANQTRLETCESLQVVWQVSPVFTWVVWKIWKDFARICRRSVSQSSAVGCNFCLCLLLWRYFVTVWRNKQLWILALLDIFQTTWRHWTFARKACKCRLTTRPGG